MTQSHTTCSSDVFCCPAFAQAMRVYPPRNKREDFRPDRNVRELAHRPAMLVRPRMICPDVFMVMDHRGHGKINISQGQRAQKTHDRLGRPNNFAFGIKGCQSKSARPSGRLTIIYHPSTSHAPGSPTEISSNRRTSFDFVLHTALEHHEIFVLLGRTVHTLPVASLGCHYSHVVQKWYSAKAN